MTHARKCLDEIVDLYQTRQDDNGPELLERVADLYFLTIDQQSQTDRDAFGDVLERMAFDANALARARLAERFAKIDLAPVDLLHRLARDEICVARPVLQYSPCLREGDLVSITSEVDQDHLIATAHRFDLTKPVTDILVQRGQQSVLVAIARNTGAEISSESLVLLSKAAENDDEIQYALRMRRDTATNPMRHLKRLTEAEFWQQMAESLLMTDVELKTEEAQPEQEEKTPDEEKDKQSKKEPKEEPGPKVRGPAAEKALAESARAGKVVEAVQCFARITQLEEGMIEHCLFQAHLPALMVLCKAHRLVPATFTALLQLRESYTDIPVTDTIGLLRRYEGMTPDTAQRIIRFSDKRRKVSADEREKAPDVA